MVTEVLYGMSSFPRRRESSSNKYERREVTDCLEYEISNMKYGYNCLASEHNNWIPDQAGNDDQGGVYE